MSIQPYLNPIIHLAMEILGLAALALLIRTRSYLLQWLRARTTAEQRDTLHRLAEEAFALAKTVYKTADGSAKLEAAIDYLSTALQKHGIPATDEEIRAVIEKAYLAYKAMTTLPEHPSA